ncbi:hypothetical protein [Mesorhizobium sp. M0907]|uniref:hypothetical protein n=2 Tax=unclassified Mesorhizobium TaxID=325217 RepID=UPI00333DCE01
MRIIEPAWDAILQRLADFIAGVMIELVADSVVFVGSVGQEDLVAVDDEEISARIVMLMLQKLAQRVWSIEQRRCPIG